VTGEWCFWAPPIPFCAFCAFSRLILFGELTVGGEFPNGQIYGADSLMAWVSRNWFGVVGSGDFAHYLAASWRPRYLYFVPDGGRASGPSRF
jgi:hypothetical protein